MWVLILITVITGEVTAVIESEHSTMMGCFDARDNLLIESEAYDGYFDKGVQIICIHTDD